MRTTKGRRMNLHYAWIVAAITFLTLLMSAGIRSMPSLLMVPFEEEFGWGRSSVSVVISVGIFLYGLVGPFSAALIAKFGIRRMMVVSMLVLAASLAATPFMTSLWQFHLLWGVVSGVSTGMMANVLGVTVANRWFSERRGLVVGMLTASAATGQLLFLPLLARVMTEFGWSTAMYAAAGFTVVVLAVAAVGMRNHPSDVGLPAYGADRIERPESFRGNPLIAPLLALRDAGRSRTFWLLSGTFFFCGFSTNGLIGTHLIAACGDYGIPVVTAAGLLALMGLFDLVGTTLSGWLTDRYDARKLLFWYYGLRGLSLLFLPYALSAGPTYLLVFSIFYGLDWIATVPPTVKLTTQHFGKEKAGMVFGWIVVSHQIGASAATTFAGATRDAMGSYTGAFVIAGLICMIAALLSLKVAAGRTNPPAAMAQA